MRQANLKRAIRDGWIVLALALGIATPTASQISIGIATPGVSIGINVPAYPQLVAVPGYPVYYAPHLATNYFFYDGLYWIYQGDTWFASSWYNGPWYLVAPEAVPVYVLRVPVRYYRRPPPYFRGWQPDAPPRWGEHWGDDWNRRHAGWDQWDRHAVSPRAPLPTYQQQYSGSSYPNAEQQAALQKQKYKYQPRDVAAQQHYRAQHGQQPSENPPQGGLPSQRGAPPPQRAQSQPSSPSENGKSHGKGAGHPPDQDKGGGRGEQSGGNHKK
jgi:hypothetical protein